MNNPTNHLPKGIEKATTKIHTGHTKDPSSNRV